MLFVATCIDKPDSLAKRMERRPAHLAYLASLGAKRESRRRAARSGGAERRSARC